MLHNHIEEYTMPTDGQTRPNIILPLKYVYRHVGKPIASNFRDLTEEEKALYSEYGYFKFEEFGPEKFPNTGSFWKQERFEKVHFGCGNTTRLDPQTAMNIATNPKFYRTMRCSHCDNHFNIGEVGQFIWECDETRVGV